MTSLPEWLHGRNLLRAILPTLVIFLGVLVSFLTIPVPYFSLMRPDMLLMLVFFWAVYRPHFYPPFMIFISGLIVDLVVHSLIGVTPLLLISVFVVIKSQRRFLMAQNFFIQWLCFAVVAIGYAFFLWATMAIYHWQFSVPSAAWMSLILNICIFPLLAIVLIKIHKIMEEK